MIIRFKCSCGKTLKAPAEAAGKTGKCPHCGKSMVVPTPQTKMETKSSALEPSDEERPSGVPAEAELESGKTRVLIADDDPDIIKYLNSLLALRGYHVIMARNGMEAIEKARTANPDVILLDVEMPKLSGFQVCRTIKDPTNEDNDSCWQTPVIMVTAETKRRDVQYADSGGAEGFVGKPFKPAELFSEIKRVMGTSSATA